MKVTVIAGEFIGRKGWIVREQNRQALGQSVGTSHRSGVVVKVDGLMLPMLFKRSEITPQAPVATLRA